MRRSMLFCPANNPKLYRTVTQFNPDCIIFDLEDSIAMSEKDSARDLLVSALSFFDYSSSEVFVRINSIDSQYGHDDVKAIVKAGVKNIRVPMCETKTDLLKIADLLDDVEKSLNIINGTVKIQAAIESPLGVINVSEIAAASKRLISISFGAEDFTNCLNIKRSGDMPILDYARIHISLVCHQFKLDAIDTVWSNLIDLEGFKVETERIMNMGFSGKSCIHPSQIDIIHNIFAPSYETVKKAIETIIASKSANDNGLGVIALDGKMIDKPIIEKASQIVSKAKQLGLYKKIFEEYSHEI